MAAATTPPRVSVGIPVHNGERFLAQALDALLGQTYTDFELVVSDNASTDRTPEICRAFAARDTRVKYYPIDRNIGPNPNFRRAFELASGEYFKWACHDDFHAPQFLERSVEVLDRDSSVVLCYARALVVDADGVVRGGHEYGLDVAADGMDRADQRLREILWLNIGSPAVYGLMRAHVLRRTRLIGRSYAADQVLLAELALHGRFHELPDTLFYHREHDDRSVFANPSRHRLAAWVEPSRALRARLPALTRVTDYLSAIRRAPLDWRQRLHCGWHVARWAKDHWREMLEDIAAATRKPFEGSVRIDQHS